VSKEVVPPRKDTPRIVVPPEGEIALAKHLFTGASRTRFAQIACRSVFVTERSARLRYDGVLKP